MDKNFSSELQGFEEVWKRVSAGRAKPKAPAGLMPGKQQKSKAVRFCGDPPRRGLDYSSPAAIQPCSSSFSSSSPHSSTVRKRSS